MKGGDLKFGRWTLGVCFCFPYKNVTIWPRFKSQQKSQFTDAYWRLPGFYSKTSRNSVLNSHNRESHTTSWWWDCTRAADELARDIARLLQSARDEHRSQVSVIPYLLFLLISRTAAEKAARAKCGGVRSCPSDRDAVCVAPTDTVKQRRRWRGAGWVRRLALHWELRRLTVKEWSWSTGRRWLRVTWTRGGLEGGSCWGCSVMREMMGKEAALEPVRGMMETGWRAGSGLVAI